MSQKVVSWALILTMLLGMFSTPVSAASQISLDKSTYAAGERVRVTVSGATQGMVDDEAFAAIYEEGAAHNSWLNYSYVKKVGTNTLDFTAPSKKGTYEMRLYSMDGTYTDATMAAKTTFTVGTVAAPTSNIKLAPDKATYAAGERVRVTVGGVTEEMVDDEAFVTIHEEDAAHKSWLNYNYIKKVGTNTVDFTAPSKKGTYEIRFYSMDGFYSDTTMLTKTIISVGTVPAPTNNIELAPEKTTYTGGEIMKITVSGVTEEMVDDAAFVAIYEEDAAHKSWQNYVYVKKAGTSTVELKAPSKKGIYDLRFFSMDGYYSDATMLTKSLIGVEMTPPATTEPLKPMDPPGTEPSKPVVPPVTADPKPPATEPSKPVVPPVTADPKPPTVQYGSFTALAVDSGVKLSWTPVSGALGYRVYRSTKQGVEGLSITDFAMNTTAFVDVNVDANTTYYYVLRVLLKEATVSGDRELLSMPSNEVSVKTGAVILGGNASDSGGKTKNVVLMKLDDPNMSYNGIKQEIDPGRGTAPQLINGRTFMPIRAVIEAMGGKIGWEDATQKITLEAGGHSVTMWLNQKDLVVDGANKEMDVAPASINGRTMVPVRFAAENVGCVVDWIASTSEIVVVFYGDGSTIPPATQLPVGDPSKPVETKPPVVEPPVTQPPAPPVTQPVTPPTTQPPTGSTTPPAKTEPIKPMKPIERASSQPDPINDPISTKALLGYWNSTSMNQGTTWIFGEDGRFAGLLVASSGSWYSDSYGYSYYRNTSAYKHLLQGDYKVTGGVITFTNCMISTKMTFDGEYWHDNDLNDASDKLLFAPLNEPVKDDDFTMEFEFIDANRLRIRLDRGALEEYDWDFKREGGPVSVPMPTHRIPPAEWPSQILTPDTPAYGDRGRIRRVSNSEYEDVDLAYQNWYIHIDRTSFASVLDYAAALRKAGWSGPGDDEILKEKKSAEDSILALISKSFSFNFQKGCYDLYITVDSEDNIRITASREIEGFWPSNLFSEEFRPPANVVYIGETKLDDFASNGDEDYYGSLEIDFYPNTLSAYMQSLKAKGFEDAYNSYSGEVFKWVRVNGRMYKVSIEPGYCTDDRITTVRYWLRYYSDFAMPKDIPPGIFTPVGAELFVEYDSDPSPIMNDDGSYGSFSFSVIGMSEADVEAYFNMLVQNGWEDSWGITKEIAWNGNTWFCTIDGGYNYENLCEFEVSFMKLSD